MDRDYEPLPIRELGASAGFRRPLPPPATPVTLESPAAEVMTDLACCAPATIRAQAPLAGANQFMITRGVRLLERPSRRTMVRGIFSLSQIARQLGVAVQTGGEVARTFAEIESAIK